MISSLITSQTRIKLLRKFFLNGSTRAHLRGLASEFDESSNAIRVELNRFEQAGLLYSLRDGNKKIYQANRDHPIYSDLHSMILKETGIDRIIDKVIRCAGRLRHIYLTGDFARGKESQVIDLILVGYKMDRDYLERNILQAEELAGRKINYIVLEPGEAGKYLGKLEPAELLQLWNNDESVKNRR
jgi:DNA-binding transcriptional ArsR family regulator